MSDYGKRDKFSDAIKKYKLMVQNAYERDLRRKGRSGDIFALKNFGWTDRTELTGKDGSPVTFADLAKNADKAEKAKLSVVVPIGAKKKANKK